MKKILVSFIQDRSGSMSTVWKETLSGFKAFVQDLQADQLKDNEVEYLFSLTTFDTQIDTPLQAEAIAKVDTAILAKFGPRAGTALYDGVGKTLQAIDDNSNITFDKAIVVIVTDGEENSSREWSKDALHAAIDERIKRGNWTFTYLGTQPETWDAASSLGVGVGASASYNAHNAHATYGVVASAAVNMSRSSRSMSTCLHDNTSKAMRSSVGMRTQTDDEDLVTAVPGKVTAKVTPAPRPTPKSTTKRSWK